MSSIQQKSVRNRLLAALPAPDFELLRPKLEPVHFDIRRIVIQSNESIRDVYFVEQGVVSMLAEGNEGRLEIGMVGPEGVVGIAVFLGSDRSTHSFLAQSEVDALRISAADMREAHEKSQAIHDVVGRFIYTMLIQTAQTAYANATLNVEARLARWLLMAQDRLRTDDIPMTHDFLGMMLSVRRPGITTATHLLEGARIIRAERGKITVLDREKLSDLADTTYGIAEGEYERLLGEV